MEIVIVIMVGKLTILILSQKVVRMNSQTCVHCNGIITPLATMAKCLIKSISMGKEMLKGLSGTFSLNRRVSFS